MSFLKDEGGSINVDNNLILQGMAVGSLSGGFILCIVFNQIELAKATGLILGGFIGGIALNKTPTSSNESA